MLKRIKLLFSLVSTFSFIWYSSLWAVILDSTTNCSLDHMKGAPAYETVKGPASLEHMDEGVLVVYGGKKKDICRYPHLYNDRKSENRLQHIIGIHSLPFNKEGFFTILFIHENKLLSENIGQLIFNFYKGNQIKEEKVFSEVVDFDDPAVGKKWDKGWWEQVLFVKVPQENMMDIWNLTLEIRLRDGTKKFKQTRLVIFNRKTTIFQESDRPTHIEALYPTIYSDIFINNSINQLKRVSLGKKEHKVKLQARAEMGGILVTKYFEDTVPEYGRYKDLVVSETSAIEQDLETILNPQNVGYWIEQNSILTSYYNIYQFEKKCGLLSYKGEKEEKKVVPSYSFMQTGIEVYQKGEVRSIIEDRLEKLYQESVKVTEELNRK